MYRTVAVIDTVVWLVAALWPASLLLALLLALLRAVGWADRRVVPLALVPLLDRALRLDGERGTRRGSRAGRVGGVMAGVVATIASAGKLTATVVSYASVLVTATAVAMYGLARSRVCVRQGRRRHPRP